MFHVASHRVLLTFCAALELEVDERPPLRLKVSAGGVLTF